MRGYRESMLSQRNAIIVAMKERGWDLAEVHDLPDEWWADERLVLESRWTPVGAKVFLTFLVDPQWEGPRTKGEAVSGPSSRRPSRWNSVHRVPTAHGSDSGTAGRDGSATS